MAAEHENYSLGPNAKARFHFEGDTVFDSPFAPTLLEAYESACYQAARAAKYAVRQGGVASRQEAQWYEAITSTIEGLLGCMKHTTETGDFTIDEKFEMPSPPEFK